MGWFQLTVIDDREKRVTFARGPNWIFHTLQEDPATIEAFVEAEKRLGGMSVLERYLSSEEVHTLESYLARIQEKEKTHSFYTATFSDLELMAKTTQAKAVLQKLRPVVEKKFISDGITHCYLSSIFAIFDSYATSYKPDSNAGMKRSPNNGGTIIVDLRKKCATIKGHVMRDLSLTRGYFKARRSETKKTPGGVINPQTGEQWYEDYGLISRLREGSAWYRLELEREVFPEGLFKANGGYIVQNPRHPTQDNPAITWVALPLQRVDTGKMLARKLKSWHASYRVPGNWTIRDGIRHIDY